MPIWEGMLFGMLLQLSVGPVCMAVLQRSVSVSFRAALFISACNAEWKQTCRILTLLL